MNEAIILLATAATLGFRHGFDWDHIAAILDLVSSTTSSRAETSAVRFRALCLSFMYALGHALLVLVLGSCALIFAAILPTWVDACMERIVGNTLLLLGIWVSVALFEHLRGRSDFQLKSRWMLMFELAERMQNKLSRSTADDYHADAAQAEQEQAEQERKRTYGAGSSFFIGMLHGIGAETGTQVLLISAIGGAASRGLGMAMLVSFVLGLLASNTLVAIASITGFATSAKAKPIYLTAGLLTCVFSLVVGTYFVTGQVDALPDLQRIMG